MRGDAFDFVAQLQGDLERSGVQRAMSQLNAARRQPPRPALEALKNTQRAVTGLDRSLARAHSATVAGFVGARASTLTQPSALGAMQAVVRAAAQADKFKASYSHPAWKIAASTPRATALPPVSLVRPFGNIAGVFETAARINRTIERVNAGSSSVRAAMMIMNNGNHLLSSYGGYGGTALVPGRRHQETINSILEAAKGQGWLGSGAHGRVLQGPQLRNSAAFRMVLKASTSYGPVVVTPNDPVPPPPQRKPRNGYNLDLQSSSVLPDTTRPDQTATFDAVWVVVMAYAQVIAQHHGTKVVVRFLGTHKNEILVGIVTNLATQGIVWLWLTLS